MSRVLLWLKITLFKSFPFKTYLQIKQMSLLLTQMRNLFKTSSSLKNSGSLFKHSNGIVLFHYVLSLIRSNSLFYSSPELKKKWVGRLNRCGKTSVFQMVFKILFLPSSKLCQIGIELVIVTCAASLKS